MALLYFSKTSFLFVVLPSGPCNAPKTPSQAGCYHAKKKTLLLKLRSFPLSLGSNFKTFHLRLHFFPLLLRLLVTLKSSPASPRHLHHSRGARPLVLPKTFAIAPNPRHLPEPHHHFRLLCLIFTLLPPASSSHFNKDGPTNLAISAERFYLFTCLPQLQAMMQSSACRKR